MKYACSLEIGDFKAYGQLAREAEDAGWDGVFVADAIGIETKEFPAFDWYDPWVVLAVMAEQTERIRLGTMIAAVPRRRPWKLAREIITLDHLSGGRMIFGAGLGAAKDDGGFYKVGEPMDLKVRAELLDEGLEIVEGLSKGKPFKFSGKHYSVDNLTMRPAPVQKPRVPTWVVGVWPKEKSMQRAIKWDGIIPQKYRGTPMDRPTPEDIRAISEYATARRPRKSTFDIIVGGSTPVKSPKKAAQQIQPFIDAGATWWWEMMWGASDAKSLSARIRKGPPRVD